MKIILHIGFSKTGSTTLQSFLFENKDVLAQTCSTKVVTEFGSNANNYKLALYAIDGRRPNIFETTFLKLHGIRTPRDHELLQRSVTREFASLLAKIGRQDRMIISSELLSGHLMTPVEVANLAQLLRSATDDIVVIAYVRRQADRLLSSYSQSIKGGKDEKLTRKVPIRFLDYKPFLDLWAEEFGRSNIIVRPLEKSILVNGDLIDDFMHHVGILNGEFVRPGVVNESLSLEALEFLRLFNSCVPVIDPETLKRNELRGNLVHLLEEWGRKRGSMRPAISPELREIVNRKFKDSNDAIAREYLGSAEGALFPESAGSAEGKPDRVWIDSEDFSLSIEVAMDIFAYLWNENQKTVMRQKKQLAALSRDRRGHRGTDSAKVVVK